MIITCVESAAARPAGTDLMAGNRNQFSPRYRQVNRLAVTGSAAAGDGELELSYGDTFIGLFRNTSTGLAPVENKDFVPVPSDMVCEPQEPLRVVIAVAFNTNVTQVKLEVTEL